MANEDSEQDLRELKIENEILKNGYKMVSVSDLGDVAIDEIADKAKEIEDRKVSEYNDMILSRAAEAGVQATDIDDLLAKAGAAALSGSGTKTITKEEIKEQEPTEVPSDGTGYSSASRYRWSGSIIDPGGEVEMFYQNGTSEVFQLDSADWRINERVRQLGKYTKEQFSSIRRND